MSKQSEQFLEEQLIAQLQKLGYKYVTIADEKALLANLKSQLEKHNNVQFSASEFEKVVNIINKGSVFEKAKILREKKHHIIKDNGDNLYFELLNVEHWCQNEYQVTNQITQEGKYENRYDVTILINGLPLVQIELKRRGLEMKEAFNQINRYQKHSFATRCIESNCDYKTVSVLLGHSNISTTLNLYVHPNMEQKKKAIEQMFKGLK